MKKCLILLLACALVCAILLPTMTPSATAGLIVSPGPTNVEVTYNVASTFTVTIPEDFSFTKDDPTSIPSVKTVELGEGSLLSYGKILTVTLYSSNFYNGVFRMKDGSNDNYLNYSIAKGISEPRDLITNNNAVVLEVSAGNTKDGASETLTFTPDTPTIAGNYTDTLTFRASISDAPKD